MTRRLKVSHLRLLSKHAKTVTPVLRKQFSYCSNIHVHSHWNIIEQRCGPSQSIKLYHIPNMLQTNPGYYWLLFHLCKPHECRLSNDFSWLRDWCKCFLLVIIIKYHRAHFLAAPFVRWEASLSCIGRKGLLGVVKLGRVLYLTSISSIIPMNLMQCCSFGFWGASEHIFMLC